MKAENVKLANHNPIVNNNKQVNAAPRLSHLVALLLSKDVAHLDVRNNMLQQRRLQTCAREATHPETDRICDCAVCVALSRLSLKHHSARAHERQLGDHIAGNIEQRYCKKQANFVLHNICTVVFNEIVPHMMRKPMPKSIEEAIAVFC